MPTTFQPRTATNNQTAALLSDLQRCIAAVFRVELLRKEGGEFVAFGDVNVEHPESGPIPGDELFADVMRAVQSKADQDGGEWFKAIAWSAPDARGIEKNLVERSFKLSGTPPGETADVDRRTAESNAIVRTNELLLTVIDRMGARYESLMKIACEVPAANVEVIKSFPKNLTGNAEMFQYMAKKLDIDAGQKDAEREFMTEQKRWEHAIRAIELVMPYVMGNAGIPPTPGKTPLVGKCHAFYASLTPEEKQRIIAELAPVGEETLKLFEHAGNAKTDDEAKAIVRKIEQVWAGQDPVMQLFKLRPIIGLERGAVLIGILKMASLGV